MQAKGRNLALPSERDATGNQNIVGDAFSLGDLWKLEKRQKLDTY